MLTFTNLIPIFLVFILYFLGMPIVYALFGSTFIYFLFINTTVQPWTILQKVMNSTGSFSMLAIPFFVMSGSVMNYGGIADKLMDFCECVTGHMKGGLAQVNVLLSMLMGGCSGSANADCAMQSKMLVPEMEKRGYSKAFSAAITAASSAATPVIPPGVNLIVYSLIAQASLGRIFAAGYVPGILMSISMMIVVAIIAHKRNYPTTRDKFPPIKEVLKQAFISFWGLFFPFGIILGMRFGLFTPAEGGAVDQVHVHDEVPQLELVAQHEPVHLPVQFVLHVVVAPGGLPDLADVPVPVQVVGVGVLRARRDGGGTELDGDVLPGRRREGGRRPEGVVLVQPVAESAVIIHVDRCRIDLVAADQDGLLAGREGPFRRSLPF